MTNQSNTVREARDAQAATGGAAPASGPFVINLCSSTTPMALVHPQVAELKRFTFFVSRRREDGRERFRLHMGHFDSLADAEEWLVLVRDLYPGAWAGEAPGKKLRAAQAAAQAQQPAAEPPPTATATATATAQPPASTVVPTPVAAAVSAPRASAPLPLDVRNIPVIQPPPAARPPAAASAARVTPKAAAAPPTAAVTTRPAITGARPAAPAAAPAPQPPAAQKPLAASKPLAAPKPAPTQAASPVATAPPSASARRAPPASALAQSNVRQVLAELDGEGDSAPTRQMPALASRAAPVTTAAPPRASAAAAPPAPPAPAAAPPVPPAPRVSAPARVPAPPAEDLDDDPALSDTQVLSMLEGRRDASTKLPPPPAGGVPEDIKLLRPDDVSTMKELRKGLSANAQVSFAIQLLWSVQPIELRKVPPLAIFSAYTLYTVEGNREGRRWYGLRLGFFSDSISAKQVALYVRSEFASVAVVPVSDREKTRATEEGRLSSSALANARHTEKPPEEFKLLDDPVEPAPPPAASPSPAKAEPERAPAKSAAARPAAGRAGRDAAGRRSGSGNGKSPRAKGIEETLEETLEILGAGQLTLDDGRKPLINDTGVRHMSVTVDTGGTGTFAKLLDRLSDRLVRGR